MGHAGGDGVAGGGVQSGCRESGGVWEPRGWEAESGGNGGAGRGEGDGKDEGRE